MALLETSRKIWGTWLLWSHQVSDGLEDDGGQTEKPLLCAQTAVHCGHAEDLQQLPCLQQPRHWVLQVCQHSGPLLPEQNEGGRSLGQVTARHAASQHTLSFRCPHCSCWATGHHRARFDGPVNIAWYFVAFLLVLTRTCGFWSFWLKCPKYMCTRKWFNGNLCAILLLFTH